MTFSVRRAVGTLTLGSAFLASLVVTGWEIGLVGVVVALVAITVLLVCSWDAPRFSVSALDAVVAAFVVWVLLVTVLRDLPWVATYQATAFLLLPLGYLVTRADGDFTWSSVWGVLVAFATSIALLSLLLVALGEPPNVYFAVRNNQAALLNVALFLSLARAPESRPLPAPLGHAIAFVLAAAIAVTGSRGGAVALVCAMVAVFLVGPAGRRSAIGVFALVVAAGFAAGTLLTMGWAAERFGDLSGGAASRWTMWRTALPLLLEHPWIGHGLGMTELAWAPIRDAYEGSHGRFLHNDYLQYAIEAGVPNYDVASWFGVMVPAKTPGAVVEKINREVQRILKTPKTQEQLKAQGADPMFKSAREANAFFHEEIAKWAQVVKASGAKAD